MTIVGFGLFAVAIAMVFGSLLLHHDVKVVYYPKKIKVRVLSPEEMAARRASLEERLQHSAPLVDLEDKWDEMDYRADE